MAKQQALHSIRQLVSACFYCFGLAIPVLAKVSPVNYTLEIPAQPIYLSPLLCSVLYVSSCTALNMAVLSISGHKVFLP